MSFFVSRQKFPFINTESFSRNVVEIAEGGRDNASPYMLEQEYPGESMEYKQPLDAAVQALNIARIWREDEKKSIYIIYKSALGIIIRIDPAIEEDLMEWIYISKTIERNKKLINARKKAKVCDLCGRDYD